MSDTFRESINEWNEAENPFVTGEFGEIGETGETGEWEAVDRWAETLGEQSFVTGEQALEWNEFGGQTATPGTSAGACSDTTYGGQPWRNPRPGRHETAAGAVTFDRVAERADVRAITLSDFDVDDYRLRPSHRRSLEQLVAALRRGLAAGKIMQPVSVLVLGEASSTASMKHNLGLSRHRSFNTVSTLQCLLRNAGIANAVQLKWVPIGESLSQSQSGDGVEIASRRAVRVQVIAPRPACGCGQNPGPPYGRVPAVVPTPNRPPIQHGGIPGVPWSGRVGGSIGGGISVGGRTSAGGQVGAPGRLPGRLMHGSLCITVTSLRRPPNSPPLPMRGPVRVIPVFVARVRVDDHRSNTYSIYELRGTAVAQRPSGSPAVLAAMRAGAMASGGTSPLHQLVASWPVAMRRFGRTARRLLTAAMGAATGGTCTPVRAAGLGARPHRLLSGAAMLAIPAAGAGRPMLLLGRRSPRLRIARRALPLRWSGRRSRSQIVLIGQMRLVRSGRGIHTGRTDAMGARRTAGRRESELGEVNEFSEFTELGEFGEDELTEYGEINELGEDELGEYGEYGEANELEEFGEDELGELGEFGELGEDELGEFGEGELGELGEDEYGEIGEDEYAESGEDELGEFGEDEYGEVNETGEYGEVNEYGEDEWQELTEAAGQSEW